MCTPTLKSIEACGFSEIPKWFYVEEGASEGKPAPFTKISSEEEFLDYLNFPLMTLPQGTVLCHSTRKEHIFPTRDLVNMDRLYWWNKTFPGQKDYGGGWFTYETNYGGPNFGINLYYELESDVTLIFIPQVFSKLYKNKNTEYFSEKTIENQEKYSQIYKSLLVVRKLLQGNFEEAETLSPKDLFFDEIMDNYDDKRQMENLESLLQEKLKILKEEDMLPEYVKNYSGSHIIEGVKNWQAKGYSQLAHPQNSFADQLGVKLSKLGINGYVSCDECEIFLSHEIMKYTLVPPFKVEGRGLTEEQAEVLSRQSSIRGNLEVSDVPNRRTISYRLLPINEIYFS